MTTELFFNKPVSGAFTGSIEGDRVDAVSFFGSASFAPQAGAAITATSASHAVQADNAQTADTAATASFVTSSVIVGTVDSASHADNANFATLATSASHAVRADILNGDVSASQVLPGTFSSGSFTITDDLTVLGTASITHLEITTTSVIFSSGSTIFGDTLDDTHQFTGSVSVTGSVTADAFVGDGSGVTGVVSASHAVNADTASFVTASNVQGVVESASFAETASFALNAVAVSTSFASKSAVAPMNINLNNFFGAEIKLQVPVPVTEHDDGQRAAVNLTGYTQARIIVRVTQAPDTDPAGVLAVQGSVDDATFVFLAGGTAAAGSGAPSASMSGTFPSAVTVVGAWTDITGTLQTDPVFLRWVTYSGSNAGGNARPRLASINLQVR